MIRMERHDQGPRRKAAVVSLLIVVLMFGGLNPAATAREFDVVIYGGTSGGITAAIQAATMGRTVALVEPGLHLGGLTSGGLGATDIGNKQAIGGLSREFYQRVKQHYSQLSAWTVEQPNAYTNRRQDPREDAMWFFEPHVAEAIFRAWLKEFPEITVFEEERLNRLQRVPLIEGTIQTLRMESGLELSGQIFIDATYEGDLLAAADVDYIVGREPNDRYEETLNGIQTAYARHHQLVPGVDPFVVPGKPESGLLPGIDPAGPGVEGDGDHRVQAYCFRMCVTDHQDNQLPFQKPEGYDERAYELLFRNFEAGAKTAPWNPIMMPNRKTDANNNRGFSTDFIGQSYRWAEASYEEREEIYQKHLLYQQGLMWTLANHERVPSAIRSEIGRWGNCRDEFQANGGWSHQLYIREARRMIGSEVMNQNHCQGRQVAERPVGLAAYTMDSHHVQRYVNDSGMAQNEGDVQVGGFPPYPVGLGSLLPRRSQCKNLIVPVCLSASHIAYGSIRMEPVFMVLGQSAATAACLAMETQVDLHDLRYEPLRKRLLEDGQILSWNVPESERRTVNPKKLKGWWLDTDRAELKGIWLPSRSVDGFVGNNYLHDADQGKGQATARYIFSKLPEGLYSVRFAYTPHQNRASNVPVTVTVGEVPSSILVNQKAPPTLEQAFIEIGQYSVEEDGQIEVRVSNESTDGFVVVDAIWILPVRRKP